jgi:hypothetical protein
LSLKKILIQNLLKIKLKSESCFILLSPKRVNPPRTPYG